MILVPNRIALTLVFTLSFLTYLAPELTASVQLAPLVLFAMLVVFRVLFSASILHALGSLFESDGLLFVLALSVLMIAPSMASAYGQSLQYALVISGCLVLARLYTAVVGIREVLEAYFWSGIVSVGLFLPLSFSALMQSIQTLDRFGYVNLQTNLLAFLLTGYLTVAVWKFLTSGWQMKILSGAVIVSCAVMIFFTSSRGALIGGFIGSCFGAGMVFMQADRERRIWLGRRIAMSLTVLVLALLLFDKFTPARDVYDFVDQALAITSPYRGVDSGFTGRFDVWKRTTDALAGGKWLLGKGMRSSDSIYPMIDNSYLVILYDLGFLPLVLIVWRFLSILWKYSKSYLCAADESQRKFCLLCCLLMVMLLAINIVERFLFGVGNPYSLLALLLFAAPKSSIGKDTKIEVAVK